MLTGGASHRFGTDKALVSVDGRTLVEGVAAALLGAGASEVVAVGGDGDALTALGMAWVPDRWPGEGPLGGLITGLFAGRETWAVVCACDLPAIGTDVVHALMGAAGATAADAVVPLVDGRRQPLLAAYRRDVAVVLEDAFGRGTRSVLAALDAVDVCELGLGPALAGSAADADTPEDLPPTRGGPEAGKAIS